MIPLLLPWILATAAHAEPACAATLDASAWPTAPAGFRGTTAPDLLVVYKSARLIQLFEHAKPAQTPDGQLACWKVGLGFQPSGHKTREGDGKTPEGWYRTSDKPQSNFYGAIAIHYPNTADAQIAVNERRIDKATFTSIRSATERGTKPPQNSPLGGEILVHGGGSTSDWTLGCIALEDAELDMLRAALPKNKAVEILILP